MIPGFRRFKNAIKMENQRLNFCRNFKNSISDGRFGGIPNFSNSKYIENFQKYQNENAGLNNLYIMFCSC
jgi:hypothetical protein